MKRPIARCSSSACRRSDAAGVGDARTDGGGGLELLPDRLMAQRVIDGVAPIAKRVREREDRGALFGRDGHEVEIHARGGLGEEAAVLQELAEDDVAHSEAEVRAAHVAALAVGAEEIHPPGPQLHYDPRYYAAQVRDPDGYSLEFVFKSWQHPQ